MNDYISREAAIEILSDMRCGVSCFDPLERAVYSALSQAISAINSVPAADVVEAIRCKDCKWKQGAECVRFADVRPFPDDFCSRAERRET